MLFVRCKCQHMNARTCTRTRTRTVDTLSNRLTHTRAHTLRRGEYALAADLYGQCIAEAARSTTQGETWVGVLWQDKISYTHIHAHARTHPHTHAHTHTTTINSSTTCTHPPPRTYTYKYTQEGRIRPSGRTLRTMHGPRTRGHTGRRGPNGLALPLSARACCALREQECFVREAAGVREGFGGRAGGEWRKVLPSLLSLFLPRVNQF